MSCAINPFSMAHQWRRRFAPLLLVRLVKNQWRIGLRRLVFLTAHQWRNGAQITAPGRSSRQFRRGERTIMEKRDRVVIIGDVTSGFRIHGPFSDNAEASAYVKRHAKRFPGDGWADNAHMLKLVNFDTMTEAEVSEYERKVGHKWAELEDSIF
jgi:hypothetical protein